MDKNWSLNEAIKIITEYAGSASDKSYTALAKGLEEVYETLNKLNKDANS